MKEFGFNDPIAIWRNNEVIEGHGRLLAVMEMDNITEIPVIRLDDLTDEQRKAYMLVHNKLTANTGFDLDMLNTELEEILDIDMTEFGFDVPDAIELEDLLNDPNSDQQENEEDKYIKCHCPKCGFYFEVEK